MEHNLAALLPKIVKNVTRFLRSIIPSDPWQLSLVLGVLLISLSVRLSWQFVDSVGTNHELARLTVQNWRRIASLVLLPIIISGVTGIFVCVWPGRTPIRRICLTVLFPAFSSLLLIFLFFRKSSQPVSVLQKAIRGENVYTWMRLNVLQLPAGFFVTALGLLLISIFVMRMGVRVSKLPVSIEEYGVNQQVDESWKRVCTVVFVLLCPLTIPIGFIVAAIFGILRLWGVQVSGSVFTGLEIFSSIAFAGALIGVALFILGTDSIRDLRGMFRLPEPKNSIGAVIVTAMIICFPECAHYVWDRIHWAAYGFGQVAPPVIAQYFDVLRLKDWLLLSLLFASVAEEIVFRGFMLQRFIEHFGLHRGIFLLGILWAAIHFRADIDGSMSIATASLAIIERIILCLGLNYVFCWAVIHEKSIISAVFAHSAWNLFVSFFRANGHWEAEYRILAVLLAAYLLYRFRPILADNVQFDRSRSFFDEQIVTSETD